MDINPWVFDFSEANISFANKMEYMKFDKYNNNNPNKDVELLYMVINEIMNTINTDK